MQYPEALVTDMGLGTQPKLKAITVLFSIFLLKPTGKEDFITILSILDLSNLLLKKKKKSNIQLISQMFDLTLAGTSGCVTKCYILSSSYFVLCY